MPKTDNSNAKAGGQGDIAIAPPATAKGGLPLLADEGRILSDIVMLRSLIKSPIYVPNEYFEEAAEKLWTIANTTVEERVKVACIKAINDICKINLLVRERQSDRPNINLHLHKHDHEHRESQAKLEGLSEQELLQLKELMEKAGL